MIILCIDCITVTIDHRCHKYENVVNPGHYIYDKNISAHNQSNPLLQTQYSAFTLLTNCMVLSPS
jgi:hypothetical protein